MFWREDGLHQYKNPLYKEFCIVRPFSCSDGLNFTLLAPLDIAILRDAPHDMFPISNGARPTRIRTLRYDRPSGYLSESIKLNQRLPIEESIFYISDTDMIGR